eukprot:CAMPEP_0116891140 /NCGR_PEP_ID=MMETSP0467-20121206/1602_1 /TAXON_ID=283647 /ORGANISM="Mesodinium pulex, Strain SPMC105" /LENGTH=95 /DNA_ID=CAMNT_0004559449 /DNA_START=944 /DNA_END=1231 /DNA_ORIENTATION=+
MHGGNRMNKYEFQMKERLQKVDYETTTNVNAMLDSKLLELSMCDRHSARSIQLNKFIHNSRSRSINSLNKWEHNNNNNNNKRIAKDSSKVRLDLE